MEKVNFVDKVRQLIPNEESNIPQFRLDAYNFLKDNSLPTLKNESWKYINLSFLNKYDFKFDQQFSDSIDCDCNKYAINGLDSYHIYVLNGKIDFNKSDMPQELEVEEIDNQRAFDSLDEHRQTYFTKLNDAFYKNCISLKVSKNIVIDKPIHIIYISDANTNDCLINTRRIFRFENNTEVTIIESFVTIGDSKSFYNGTADIFVGENSTIHHIKLQQDSNSDVIVDFIQANQQKYSNYVNLTFTTAGNFVRNNLNSKLNDENIEAHFLGVFIADNNNLVDNRTLVDHLKPNCFSNENYRGILFDRSTGIFNGKILVHPDAQKTNAYQSNKNILASNNATINTKPELEIYADDVKCSHGATSGALDKNSLFYLRARGIDAIKAESLLMNAFVAEVIDELKNKQLKNYLHNITRHKLNEDLKFIDNEDLINIDEL
ncbi:MAG TPA: Fe-S cluster assembly protein SufD [Candidatus Kapabacteria bacterium]|nr:Fe-S cluster assembly protein SufD [Candidatus Kapabacteria bacterium]